MEAVHIDPFASVSAEFIQDPFPTYKTLREQSPILWNQSGGCWVVTRYDDVLMVLRDKRFAKRVVSNHICTRVNSQLLSFVSNHEPLKTIYRWYADNIKRPSNTGTGWLVGLDPPEHTLVKASVAELFKPSAVKQLKEMIESLVTELIDRHSASGHFDVIADFALPLPFLVIGQIVGIPADDMPTVKTWCEAIVRTFDVRVSVQDRVAAESANKMFKQYLSPLMKERASNPKNDVLTSLITLRPDRSRMTLDNALSNAVLLTLSGYETIVGLIGGGILNLLRYPSQLDLLRSDPQLIESAVEEILRFDPSAQSVDYVVAEPVLMGGHQMNVGDKVVAVVGSANRDAKAFERPDVFDICRKGNNHLSFGAGTHYCLGASLARLEAQIAILSLVQRMPNLRLATEKIYYERVRPRTPVSLPVLF